MPEEPAPPVIPPPAASLLRRLINPPKPPYDKSANTQTRRAGNKLTYDISPPQSLSIGVAVFGVVNILVGVLVWKTVPPGQSGMVILPFALNTALIFLAAANIGRVVRTIEISSAGVAFRGQCIPLARITEITAEGHFPVFLKISSDTEVIKLFMGRRQAEWLKKDMEHEIWTRRGQTPKKGPS